MTVHRGAHHGRGATREAVVSWGKANGLEMTRRRWEIYGHWYEDPEKLETEIYWVPRSP